MKKIFTIICIFIVLFMVTGCVKKTGDPVNKESKRPVAEGEAYAVNNLAFFLPKELQKSPYNGMLGVYEYYTGEFKDAGPTGVDVMILTDKTDKEFDIKDYASNKSSGAKDKIEMKKTKINDYDWYVGKTDNINYYCCEFNDVVYEVIVKKNTDPTEIYEDVIKMLEKTMYLEEIEEK